VRVGALALVGLVGCAKPVETIAPTSTAAASTPEPQSPEPSCVVELDDPAALLGGAVSMRSIAGAPLANQTSEVARFEGPSDALCDAVIDKASLVRIPADSSRSLESVHSQFTEALEWHGLTVGEPEQRVADDDAWHVAYYDRAASPPALLYVAATRLPDVDAVFMSVYVAKGSGLRRMMTAFQRSALSLASPWVAAVLHAFVNFELRPQS